MASRGVWSKLQLIVVLALVVMAIGPVSRGRLRSCSGHIQPRDVVLQLSKPGLKVCFRIEHGDGLAAVSRKWWLGQQPLQRHLRCSVGPVLGSGGRVRLLEPVKLKALDAAGRAVGAGKVARASYLAPAT